MDANIIKTLRNYIEDETRDHLYYSALSKAAPTEEYENILMSFANDELSHANGFRELLKMATGTSYTPDVEAPVISEDFGEELRKRILNESDGYKQYANEYLRLSLGSPLKKLFFIAKTDENVHIQKLLYMLLGN